MMTPTAITPPPDAHATHDPQIARDVNSALHGIDGFSEFTAAANGFIKGEVDIEKALELMLPFLQGDICQDEEERKRIIQLGQTIEAKCGWVSIGATITACTAAFSCSIACC
ncbi:hypothetical protein [Planomonospora sp. ID82291]|uniref:hypothetical protein n=1 Tax=Planomonospora sp. ID82291 TaxID=2738136 RepID=UPI0018C36BA3|nr:hypothetical protein [Planomonospora sp. ID82291]MBG0812784.1 hypothetical protein [Planomonospora sp. ID82291]